MIVNVGMRTGRSIVSTSPPPVGVLVVTSQKLDRAPFLEVSVALPPPLLGLFDLSPFLLFGPVKGCLQFHRSSLFEVRIPPLGTLLRRDSMCTS